MFNRPEIMKNIVTDFVRKREAISLLCSACGEIDSKIALSAYLCRTRVCSTTVPDLTPLYLASQLADRLTKIATGRDAKLLGDAFCQLLYRLLGKHAGRGCC